MPLHVFIAQSASLVTGGIEVWKAAKDVLIVVLVPLMLLLSYKRGLFKDKTFRWLMILGAVYTTIHMFFVVFDTNDDTYSAIVGSVYNTRLFGFLLLGYVVGTSKNREKYLKWLLTVTVLIASVVALFGVLQYFLPGDLLTHVGYSIERGVKPLFYIDDKPDLPRVMSTLRDPNSLGTYLILPILLVGVSLLKKGVNEKLYVQSFRRGTLIAMLVVMLGALFLTFSRGAALGLGLSLVTILSIVTGQRVFRLLKKYFVIVIASVILISFFMFQIRNTYFFQNVIFHADQSTVLADPNELRVSLTQEAIDEIIEQPQGYGPGTAGLVSINNPLGGRLTENYYLQIAHEVGWVGLLLFIAIIAVIIFQLYKATHRSPVAVVLFACAVAYAFYSLLIHLWSNEAIALQWWLLVGAFLGTKVIKQP